MLTETNAFSDLHTKLKGRVIVPGDDGYDEARQVFVGGIDRRPAVIIRAVDAEDVAHVVSLANETGQELAVRSGGHSGAGYGVSAGGIVLDLRDMRALEIDVEGCTAWVEAGLTAGEYTEATGAYGLATGFGDTGSVGIGGITLGGGVGFLSRKYGLTIDDLLAAEIVTADSRVLYVDADSHPDLFWAIRGGGGNFGVVTRFKFRLHPVDTILGGILILPATPETIATFISAANTAPDELTTIANVMPAPPMPFIAEEHYGQLVILAFLCYTGDPEEGERVIVPFRALARPVADLVRPIRYPEMYFPEDPDYHPRAVAHTLFLNTFDSHGAQTIIDYLEASDSPMRVAQLRVLGGAVARVPVEATAYAHRQSPILVNLAAFYETPEEQIARQRWLDQFVARLNQGDTSAYVNFLGDEGAARVRDAYPDGTWQRLVAIKRRYDPGNLFRLNQNITPAYDDAS